MHGTFRSSSNKKHDTFTMCKKLSSRTHFTSVECQSLLTMHSKIVEHGILDRLRFREVIHACFDLYEDLMLDRVFRAFDKNNDGQVDAVEWVEGCSVLIRGHPDELIDFSYYVYNINGDGYLDREELFQYLRRTMFVVPHVMPQEDVEESVRDIVEICMRKLDKDKDGQVTYKDFEKSCHLDPLLVQALGPCIPNTRSLAAFLACFTDEHRTYTPNWGDVWFKNTDKQLQATIAKNFLHGTFASPPVSPPSESGNPSNNSSQSQSQSNKDSK